MKIVRNLLQRTLGTVTDVVVPPWLKIAAIVGAVLVVLALVY